MEVILKKALKIISTNHSIPYETLKSTTKKYLKYAKNYDESLYETIDELLSLVDITSLEELEEYDINTLKMFCKLRDIESSGTEKDIRKCVASYFEEVFEDMDNLDSDDESVDESEEEEQQSLPEEEEIIQVVKQKKSKK